MESLDPHHSLALYIAPETEPMGTTVDPVSARCLPEDVPASAARVAWWQTAWNWIAFRPENAARLVGMTAFVYGALPTIGGSAVTVWSILGASWSMLYLLAARPRPKFTTAQWVVAAAYLFFALTTLVSGLVRKDPWHGLVRAVNDWPFLYSLLSLCVLASLGPVDCRRPLARGAAIGSILGFLLGAFQFLCLDTGVFRPSGGAGNSAQYGQAGMLLAFLSMMCFSRETPEWRRLSIGGFLCGLGAVVVSGSRAAAVTSAVLVLPLLWLLWKNRERFILRRAALVGALAVAVGFVTFPLWKESSPAKRFRNLVNRLDQVDNNVEIVESIDQRMIQIRASWKALWRRPWLGYGMQHRMKAIAKLEPPQYASAFRHTHIHFLYLDYAVGNGVIGFLSLLLLLATPVAAACLPADLLFSERFYGGCILTIGYGTLGLAGASLGMDIGNTIFACFGTMLVVAAPTSAAAEVRPASTPRPKFVPVRRAA